MRFYYASKVVKCCPEYTEADLDYHNKDSRVSVSKSVSA